MDELRQIYVETKLDQFFGAKTLIRKTLDELVGQFNYADVRFIDRDSSTVLNQSFDEVDLLDFSVGSEPVFKPVFLVNFSTDLSKCPLTVCLLVVPPRSVESPDEAFATFRQTDASTFAKIASNVDRQTSLLVDVSSFLMTTEKLDNWQLMWSTKACLDPTVYSHDLVCYLSLKAATSYLLVSKQGWALCSWYEMGAG